MSSTRKFFELLGAKYMDSDDLPMPKDTAVIHGQDWKSPAGSPSCWSQSGDCYFPVSQIVPELAPGSYRCRMSNAGPYLERMPIAFDSLLALPDSASEELLAEFKKFWTLKDKFKEHGFGFKRGFLMWGPAGGGKTSCVWQMTQAIVDQHKGIVVFVEQPEVASACLGFLRKIEPDRPLICVLEDLDSIIDRHGEHAILAMLDGENQVSNVVFVATTNYPEKLDRRLIDRPSRFDTIMFVDMPSPAARRMFFEQKVPNLDSDTLVRWTKASEGMSIAHLREIIVATQCLEQPEKKVFDRLEEMRYKRQSSEGLGTKVGFH